MRTTITLSPDVEEKVKAEMRDRGVSFKDAVNSLIRRGHEAKLKEPARKPFKVRPIASGPKPGFNFDNVGELLEQLDELEPKEWMREFRKEK